MSDSDQSIAIKIALIEDSIADLTKAVSKIESVAQEQKEKGTKMLICIISCVAAIVAAILQGVLSGR